MRLQRRGMPKTRAARAGLAACVASLFVASRAMAEPTPSPPRPAVVGKAVSLRVEYVAPASCPTREDFEALVRARTPLAEFGDDARARSLRVELTSNGDAFHGHLEMSGIAPSTDKATPHERDVDGETCADVVDALGLVTALAIDPDASTQPTATLQVATPPPTTTAPPTTPPPEAAPGPARTPIAPAVDRPAPPAQKPAVRWHGNVGGAFAVEGALSPDPLLGGAIDLEAEAPGAGLAPSFRLTALASTNTFLGSRQASFTHFAVRLDGCPFRLGVPSVGVRACLLADIGFMRAVGVQITIPKVAVEPSVDLGALVRGRWSPGGGRFFLEGDVALLFPVTQPTYEFTRPVKRVYQVPPVAVNASLGPGVQFW